MIYFILFNLQFFSGLTEHGHNWSEISLMVGTKSDVQCKTFYLKYKKKLNLVAIMKEYKLNHVSFYLFVFLFI